MPRLADVLPLAESRHREGKRWPRPTLRIAIGMLDGVAYRGTGALAHAEDDEAIEAGGVRHLFHVLEH